MMNREVRWSAECRRKGTGSMWTHREDVCYSGWFHSTGNDTPSDTLLEHFNDAVETEDWLEWRLIQEERTFSRQVIRFSGQEPE